MFNFFNRRKKKINEDKLTENEVRFISTIVNALSSKYPKFKEEIDLETFVYVAPNKIGEIHSFVFGLNNMAWKKLCDPSISNFDVKNIRFLDAEEKRFSVDLYISEGLIIGYTLPKDVNKIKFETIDVSNIWEKHFFNEDYSEIRHVIDSLEKSQQKKLNMLKNTFKIEFQGNVYYPIYDRGDGNYCAIDKHGAVFNVTHDPFIVEKEHQTIEEMFECKKLD